MAKASVGGSSTASPASTLAGADASPAPAGEAGEPPVGQELADTDRALVAWIEGVLRAAPGSEQQLAVVLGAPAAPQAQRGARVDLIGLATAPAEQSSRSTVLQFEAQYLVTTWAEAAPAAHQLLAEILFAALADHKYEVNLTPQPAEIWQGLGLARQPSAILRAVVSRARHQPAFKRVRALRAQTGPAGTFRGRVVGPDDLPLGGALVQLPALSRSAVTDHRGCFVFPFVPAEPRLLTFTVQAKGESQTIRAERPDDDMTFVSLQFHLKEE